MVSLIHGIHYNYNQSCRVVTIHNSAVFGENVGEYDLNRFVTNSNGEYTFTHDNGWTITSKPNCDYYVWITKFNASHPIYGKVWSGDLNKSINGDNREALRVFLKFCPLCKFDLGDHL